MSSGTPVGPGPRVELRFSLILETGEKFDSTGEDTVICDIGDGNLLPAFEKAMFGMVSGDSATHLVHRGFGDHNIENIQQDKNLYEPLKIPFQYGYGGHAEHVCKEAIGLKGFNSDLPIKFITIPNCKQRDVKNFGQ